MKKLLVFGIAAILAPCVFVQGKKAASAPAEELRPAKLSASFRASSEEAFDAAKRADARHLEGGIVFQMAHLDAERLIDAARRKAATDEEKNVALYLSSYLSNVRHCAEGFQAWQERGVNIEVSYKPFVKLRDRWRRDIEVLLGMKTAKRGG